MKIFYDLSGCRGYGFASTILLFFLASLSVQAQTTLGPGDLAFTQLNGDMPDGFSLVLLTDVESGTSFVVTDDEFVAGTGLNTGEGRLRITFSSPFSCGDEFLFSSPGGTGGDFTVSPSSGVTLTEEAGNIQFSTSGDGLIAFQDANGTATNPTSFIASLNISGGTSAGGANSPAGNTDLPTGLVEGQSAIWIDNGNAEFDNARYLTTATTSGTPAALAIALNTRANWEGGDASAFPLAAYGFTCLASCTDPVLTSLSQNPSAPTCPNASVNILINGTLNDGTGWFLRTGSSTGPIINGPVNTTQFTVNPTETTTFFVTADDCSGNTVSQSITLNTIGEIADAGADQFSVAGTSTTLAALAPTNGGATGLWTIENGDGNGMFGDATSPTSTFSGTAGQNYELRWTVTNTPCATTFDRVEVSFSDPAQLGLGDLAFTGYNSSDPDQFSFVLLTDVNAGTEISFTDNGWLSSGAFRSGEGSFTLTLNRAYGCGTIFLANADGGWSVSAGEFGSAGSVVENGTIALALPGDQVFAYQGTLASPTLLTGIQMNGAWDADATDSNSSAQPTGFVDGVNSVSIDPQINNAQYDCSTEMGSPEALRMAINTAANWNVADGTPFDLELSCDFACQDPCLVDSEAPTSSSSQGIDCGETVEVVTSLGYIYTFDPPVSAGTSAQNCWSGVRLRSPNFVDNCSVDSVAITFQAAAGTTPSEIPATLEFGGADGTAFTFSNGETGNFVLPAPSIEFYAGTSGPATTEVIFTVFDEAGNSNGDCSYFINVSDDQDPEANCADDFEVLLDGDGMASVMIADVNNGSTDNCGISSLGVSPTEFTCDDAGTTQTVTLTVTDGAGNPAMCTTDVTIIDDEDPMVECETAVDVALEDTGTDTSFIISGTFILEDLLISFDDNCSAEPAGVGSLPGSQLIFTCEDLGQTFNTGFRFADASDNFMDCFIDITVTDPMSLCNTAPVAVCQNVEVDLTNEDPCLANVTADDFDNGSFDPDGDDITLSIDPAGPFILGVTNIILTVSDGQATDTCEITLTAIDNTPPEFANCPEDTTLVNDPGECSAVFNFDIPTLVEDPCNNPPAVLDLATILNNYNSNIDRLTGGIPNQFILDGDDIESNDISDGGDDAYDGGNEMNTDSASTIEYSEGFITMSDDFGPGSAYFTQYNEGVWMMAADIVDLTFYEITGNLGADGDGFVYSFEEDFIANDGTVYSAFFKGVTENDDDPTVNHVIIVADAPGTSQQFSLDTDDDFHRVDGLAGASRIYQFNWYGQLPNGNGYVYSDTEIESIILLFLNTVVQPSAYVIQTEGPESGSALRVGSTDIEFTAIDIAGDTSSTCSYTVTVLDTEAPQAVDCPSDTTIFATADSCEFPVEFATPEFTDNCIRTSILFVSDNENETEIPAQLRDAGYEVEVVLNDYVDDDTKDNVVLQGDLSEYIVIYWHAVGEGSGDEHNTTTINNLEAYVQAGGNLFVTGYDVIDSPDDPLLAQLLGGLETTDTPSSSDTIYPILGPANALNSGLFDIIGLVPFDAGDEDALQDLTSETVTVLDSDEGARWALRTTPGGLVAWVSTDNRDLEPWEPWETPGSGYYEALRNFAFNISPPNSTLVGTQTAGPASGELFGLGETTVTFEAVDTSGNVGLCSFVVTVSDTIAPVISCISDTIYLDENGMVSDAPGENVTIIEDNCPPMSIVGDPLAIFTCDDLGVNEFNGVTRIDESGNESEPCDFTVTILDTIPPTIVCEDIDVFLDADGFAMIENDDAIISITDNCTDSMNLEGPFTIGGPDARTFGCDDVGNPRTIMVIATDESDNTDTCTYVATTLDRVPPTLECPETFTSFLDENGIDTTMNSEIGFTAMDACMVEFPIARIIGGINNRVFGCDDAGETFPRDFFVTDNSENSSDTCTVLIEVLDTISPTLTCVNDTVFLDATGAASFDISALIVDTDDNCEVLEVAADVREAGCDDVNTQLPFTLTVEDPSGNSASCDVLVLVRDEIAPVITCPEDVTIECDDETEPGTIVMETASGAFATETAIPDDTAAGINTTATVSGIPATATIDDIRIVDFTMNHTWVGDLILVLTAPTGETLELVNRAGAPPGTFGDSSNSNVAGPISFDDAATDLAEDMGSTIGTSESICVDDGICTYAPNDGTTSFASLIADLAGADPNGSWTINISDNAGGDLGTIFSWNIEIDYSFDQLGFATATDNCSAEVTFSDSTTQVLDGSCDEFTYEIFRSFVATDPSGNADTCVQVITVEDTQAPDLICNTVTVEVDDDLGNIVLDDSDLVRVIEGTMDNCDANFTAAFSQLEFDCSDIDPETNQITVDVTAVDVCENDTTCTVMLDVAPAALNYDFACITELNVTLDDNCQAEVIPAMVLTGEDICLDLFDFEIVIMDDDPSNGPIIDGCGTFQYMITEVPVDFDAALFETCWGFINAEDKTSPELDEELTAPSPLYCDDLDQINVNTLAAGVSRCWIQSGETGATLDGSMNPALRNRLLAGGGIPNFLDNCSNVEICVNDQVDDNGPCVDVVLTRTFTVRDGITCDVNPEGGNPPTVYAYEIIFTRPDIDDVDAINPTAEFECQEELNLLPPNQFGDENPVPEVEDFPFFEDESGPVFLTSNFCNLGATFRDGPRIETCPQSYKFVRTFTVIDWCQPEVIRDFTQLVKVGDFDAPVIGVPTQDLDFNGEPDDGPLFFSTSNPDCSANFLIPSGEASDNCDPDPSEVALIYPFQDLSGAPVGPFMVGGPAFGIPAGLHTLRYIATDACGNADTLDVDLEIGDRTAPVAICEDGLDISLGGAGQAELCGEDIDQASYDECSDITRLIAFVGDNNLPLSDAQTFALTGIAQGGWRECITLTCEILDDDPNSPDFVAVGLLVTDEAGNSNSCWLDVLLEDKLPPLCVAPPPITTTCDDEDILDLPQDLEEAADEDPTTTFALLDQIFGSANGIDNCPTIDISQTVIDTRNSCGVGQIIRSFTVTDGEGFTSTGFCSQTITVLGVHDYTIRFPEDFASNECVEPDYDGVTFEERGCDLITTTTRIDTFEATADECYKLRITYEVLNWCEYNTEEDPYEVPRDADNDDILTEATWLHVLPNDESTLTDDIAWLDRDANRFNGFISPLDEDDPNGQVPGSSNQPYGTDEARGAFLYRQFIAVYDDVAPTVADITGDLVFEDQDGNCAEPVVLTIDVDDACTSADDYTGEAELDPFFEDVDGDGNLTLADFVPTADPGLQPNVANNNGTFTISFNVELPIGRHAVRFRATDGCGNAETILVIFEVIDDKAPTPVCINGLTVTLMPDGNGGGMAAIWASEYVVSDSDDCTGPIKFAIYHPDDFEALDNGTLVPNVIDTGIVLDCDDEGMLIVRVYAIDGAGQSDYCETTLSVQRFQPNVCEGDGGDGNIFGAIESPAGNATPDVAVSISDDGSMDQTMFTNQGGEYGFTDLTLEEDYTIDPELVADVNVATAVTTFDALLINRHILGIAELQSPYQHIVADVNMDGQINVLDVVHIRMVIMGQTATYPQGPSWRFVDQDYEFSADASDWLEENFPEVHNANDLQGDILNADFYALEMGNVSEGVLSSAELGSSADSEARSSVVLLARVLNLSADERSSADDIQLEAGNTYDLDFTAEDLYGLQGTLELGAGLELVDISYGLASAGNINLENAAEGIITFSWDDAMVASSSEASRSSEVSSSLFTLNVRATADATLSDVLSLTDRVTRSEGYPTFGGVANLSLDFATTTATDAAEFSLGQNSPNPVDAATQIAFSLPVANMATLTIRDVQGRTILVREIEAETGENLINLQRSDLAASGVYSYTLTAGEHTATKQMVIR